MKCAGVLAGRNRKHPRYIAKRRYNTPDKEVDISMIGRCIKRFGNSNILTFEGAGKFTEYVMKKLPLNVTSLYSVDNEEKIIEKAKLEGKRWKTKVHFINKELIEFLKRENKTKFDVVWLDYCGNFTQEKVKDIKALKKHMALNSFFFITLLRAREHFGSKGSTKVFIDNYDEMVDTIIGNTLGVTCFYKHEYKSMVTYGFATKDWYEVSVSENILSYKTNSGTDFINKKVKRGIGKIYYYPQDFLSVKRYFRDWENKESIIKDQEHLYKKRQFMVIRDSTYLQGVKDTVNAVAMAAVKGEISYSK